MSSPNLYFADVSAYQPHVNSGFDNTDAYHVSSYYASANPGHSNPGHPGHLRLDLNRPVCHFFGRCLQVEQ